MHIELVIISKPIASVKYQEDYKLNRQSVWLKGYIYAENIKLKNQ
jgi:hypothetical protein